MTKIEAWQSDIRENSSVNEDKGCFGSRNEEGKFC